MDKLNSYKLGPDQNGRFGIFGGRFVAVDDLREKYNEDNEKLEFLEDYNDNLEEIFKQFESRLLTS